MRISVEDSRTGKIIKLDAIQNIYQAVISKHALSILEKKPLDGADAVHNLELVLACHESARHNGQQLSF